MKTSFIEHHLWDITSSSLGPLVVFGSFGGGVVLVLSPSRVQLMFTSAIGGGEASSGYRGSGEIGISNNNKKNGKRLTTVDRPRSDAEASSVSCNKG